eukprot:Gregarina_sp_Pseudo_9__4980@NODE_521_length_2653_cov_4_561974_g492_i0_p1_GENE_NODE_521_length_2653_cov_4_561974_g492_i0NODE_521_length_2653_cov_4_561974_g492_i0_p1_ORF_typecomplete_len401_score21_85DUF4899/PF16240_5/0_011CARD_2/PF16739_5/10CARD_2/PF16739_5/4_9_NODE_521_length_2653_cov_4_561974_g492_i010262228
MGIQGTAHKQFDKYERGRHRKYRASVYVVSRFPLADTHGSWVHLCHRAELLLFGDDELVYLTYSTGDDVPIVATRKGYLYAFLPNSTEPGWLPADLSHYSELAQLNSIATNEDEAKAKIDELRNRSASRFIFEWVPVSDPVNGLTKKSIYYLSVECDNLSVVLYDTFLTIPMLGEAFINKKVVKLRIPLCLPISMMTQGELPTDIERWFKFGQEDVTALPWPFLDEYRYRRVKQELCQCIWSTALQIVDSDSERLKQLRKSVEILTLRQCMKILQENLNDGLSEAAKHLAYSSSLNFLSRNAAKKGERLLTEEISNIKQTKDVLKELRHNLTSETIDEIDEYARDSSSTSKLRGSAYSEDCSVKPDSKVAQSEEFLQSKSIENLIHKCVTKKRRMEGAFQ